VTTMNLDLHQLGYTISVWTIPVLIAVTFHEAAHGVVAWQLGDDTAKRLGRVTFNPFKHIDPFGTVLLPVLLLFASGGRIMFGFAKPVPVDFRRLNNPRRDMVLVAVAGPATNLLLVLASALLFHVVGLLSGNLQAWVAQNLINMMWINALLCVFNMLPIPPLDGGRVVVGLLPYRYAAPLARLERAGILIVLGVVFLLPMLGNLIGVRLDVFTWVVGVPAQALMTGIARLAGVM